ncbi:hypothetical protein ACVRW4_07115 [Streptococcus phocae subsp. phocae]
MLKQKRTYSLRKLSKGLGSVLLLASFIVATGPMVKADQTDHEPMELFVGDYWYENEEDAGTVDGYTWGMSNWWKPSYEYDSRRFWTPENYPNNSRNDVFLEESGPYEPPYGGALGKGWSGVGDETPESELLAPNKEQENQESEKTAIDKLKEKYQDKVKALTNGLSSDEESLFWLGFDDGFNKRSRNSTISDSLYDMGFGAGGYYRQRLSTSEAETSEGMAREQKLEDINLEKEAQKNRDKNEGIEAGYRDAYFGSEFPESTTNWPEAYKEGYLEGYSQGITDKNRNLDEKDLDQEAIDASKNREGFYAGYHDGFYDFEFPYTTGWPEAYKEGYLEGYGRGIDARQKESDDITQLDTPRGEKPLSYRNLGFNDGIAGYEKKKLNNPLKQEEYDIGYLEGREHASSLSGRRLSGSETGETMYPEGERGEAPSPSIPQTESDAKTPEVNDDNQEQAKIDALKKQYEDKAKDLLKGYSDKEKEFWQGFYDGFNGKKPKDGSEAVYGLGYGSGKRLVRSR